MQNKLLQSIEVGGLTFKNRIMFPPLTTGYEKNGMLSEQDMGFYTRLAKGGVGYIVLGDVAPINSFSPTPKLFEDSQIPAFKALADSVHAYGTKLGVQIFHPEYDVDTINRLFMEKKFDEMRQRLHHDMMFFTDEVSEEMLQEKTGKTIIPISAKEETGIDKLEKTIQNLFYEGSIDFNDEVLITNVRYKTALQNALNSLNMVKQSIENQMPEDFLTIDLMDAYEQLGTIIGEAVEDDLVNEIFGKFCMGK